MRKTIVTFGLLAGAILSATILLTIPFMDTIGFDAVAMIGYSAMVVAFLLIYFGVRAYRDTVAGGTVTFGRALTVGLLITLVATCSYVATWQLVHYTLIPDFGERYAAYALSSAEQDGATPAELETQRVELAEFAEMYNNPMTNIAVTFLEPLPIGVVFALVSAGVLGRRRRPDEAAT